MKQKPWYVRFTRWIKELMNRCFGWLRIIIIINKWITWSSSEILLSWWWWWSLSVWFEFRFWGLKVYWMSEFWIESHHSLSKPKNQITNVGVRFWWPVLRIEKIQRSKKKPSTAQSKGRWGSEVPPPVAISTKIKKFKSSMTDVPPSPSILKTTSTPRTPRSESNSNSIWNLKSVYEKKKKKKNPLGNGDHKE